MRIETGTNQAIRHVHIGLTRDEALTLWGNLDNWARGESYQGDWRLDIDDGEREMSIEVTNDPRDPRFASRFAGAF
jgi:hypothetical protein